MARIKSLFCCSLLTGSLTAGIVSLTTYIAGLVIEIYWMTATKGRLPIPAFSLSGVYIFQIFLTSLLLMGLRSRKTIFIISWISMTLILLFPEAGMVLFMALHHWSLDINGVIEMSVWIIRLSFNILGLISLPSLYIQWKNEKAITKSSPDFSRKETGIPGDLPSFNVIIQANDKIGYPNPAYTSSIPNQMNSSMVITKHAAKPLKRSISSASQFVSAAKIYHNVHRLDFQTRQLPMSSLHIGVSSSPYYKRSSSVFSKTSMSLDFPSFGLHPDDPVFVNEYHTFPPSPSSLQWYRHRSLGDLNKCLDGGGKTGSSCQNKDDADYLRVVKKSRSAGSLTSRPPRSVSSIYRKPYYLSDCSDGSEDGWRDSSLQTTSIDCADEYRDVAL